MMTRMTRIEIPRAECEELLASATLGRLGVIVDGRPEIFPVHHAYDAASCSVVFETTARTKLHAALNWPWVAFEVDDVAPEGVGGWSVLVVGRAEEISNPGEIERIAALHPGLWSAGDQARWLRIVPTKVTGRRVIRRGSLL
jgi:nitroimidazol reductase NimA-like FMN-containing flavoprotein (pyridoxamine 5'-phosphate oxidase superfamily)